MTKEDAINNSWQILNEFKVRNGAYYAPHIKWPCKGKNGKVKIYTEEEIFLYKCRLIADRLNFK